MSIKYDPATVKLFFRDKEIKGIHLGGLVSSEDWQPAEDLSASADFPHTCPRCHKAAYIHFNNQVDHQVDTGCQP